MGRASKYGDATDSPQTRCTNCRTVFEVSAELLSSSDTRVRCGECLSIFDALANLRDPDEESGATESPGKAATSRKSPAATDRDDTGGDHVAADDEASAGLDDPADETGSLDVTYSDFDLFSGDAGLPDVAYLDETSDTPEFDFDGVDLDEEETFSDMLFAHDATIGPAVLAEAIEEVSGDGTGAGTEAAGEADDENAGDDAGDDGEDDGEHAGDDAAEAGGVPGSARPAHGRIAEVDPDFIDDDEPVEPLVFEYREADATGSGRKAGAAEHVITTAAPGAGGTGALPLPGAGATHGGPPSAPTTRGAPWLLRTLLGLALVGLLVGLYAYRERGRLHNDPLARPVLLVACRAIGCTVPSRVDLASLKLLDRKVFTHPTEPDALVINVAFRNSAAFEQRFPVLVVRLRDRIGRAVAERDFSPSEYLERWAPGDTLAAGVRLDITLEVDDPGAGAESYEFEFREAVD